MSRRCCCGACFLFEDNFEGRTTLGGDWTEVSGTWTVAGNRLVGSAGGGLLGCTKQIHLHSAGEMSVGCSFINPSIGMKYILYACLNDGYGEGYRSEHVMTDGSYWTTTLYKDGGVVDSVVQLATTFPSGIYNSVIGYMCIETDGNVKTGVVSLETDLWAEGLGYEGGRKFGVGHDNAAETWFDDFYAEELKHNEIICNRCFCPCCTKFPQKTLHITFFDCSGRADCMCGVTGIPVTDIIWNFSAQGWIGTVNFTSGCLGCVSGHWEFLLTCDASLDVECTGQNWKLSATTGCPDNFSVYPNKGSTCEPLNLIYGPFALSPGDLDCSPCYPVLSGPATGSYYLVVTE
jgi:hypothetical protein